MTNKELINDLRHYSNVAITAAVGQLVNDAADAIETLEAKVSYWVSVEERLPDPIHPTDTRYKAYLICDSLDHIHVADYTYSKHFSTCYSFHVNGEEKTDVKYWMPIEPPQEV